MIIFSSGRMSVVNAEERAGRDFIATGFCTKHEKRENPNNTLDDLESKVQLQFKSTDKQKVQFNSVVRKETKSLLFCICTLQHISELCRNAASQLNVLKRLKQFICFNERKILVQSFVYSNFDYCPLIS